MKYFMLMKPSINSSERFVPLVILIPFLAILVRCSTYFNMVYNAESAFNEGYVLHEKVLRNFPDSIVVEPPASARAKYDRAIEKAAKVLEVFPKSKKWHDDAYFLLGKSYFYEKETGKALRWFQQLLDEFPRSSFVPESYAYIAEAHILDDNLAKAEETLVFALKQYPFLDKNQRLSLLLVETAVRREGNARAVELIEKARGSAQSEKTRYDMLVRAAELYRDLGQYDKAAALLRSAPRGGKKTGQNYRVDRDLVSCLAASDSLEQALRLLDGIKEQRQYAPYRKEILFTKGTLLARQGRIDEAIGVFREVTGGGIIDSTAARADTSSYAGRAWYELGLLYQKRKSDYREAEKYFALAAERQKRDTAVTPLAERRLKAMKSLRDQRAAIAAGGATLDRYQRLFAIGELFRDELDEPDSACRQFCALAGDSAAGPVYTPKALCAAAYLMRRDKNDTLRSDSLYSLIIERFPGSDYVAAARQEMDPAPAVVTRREQAAAAFRSAEKLYLAGDDVKAAVQAYYNVYRQYADLEIAEKSLFAAAWITDNDLLKKKVAKTLYGKICDHYPKSIYCTGEAQPRLKTVIDTLEAMRRQNRKAGGMIDSAAGKAGSADTGSAHGAAVDSLKQTASKGDSGNAGAPRMAPILPPPSPGTDSLLNYTDSLPLRYKQKLNPGVRMMMQPPATDPLQKN
jgi:tetratricopeptide (TPR) repeat protein